MDELISAALKLKRILDRHGIGFTEGDNIRGLYGRVQIDTVNVDILADVKLRYRGKWLHLTYENLTPCTIEVTLTDEIPVRVPCPEIQTVAD